MIIEAIVLVIFVLSFGGALFILARKLPVLNSLPQNVSADVGKNHIILSAENKIKEVLVFFKKQIFFHKFLSWVKVMTLKFETKVDHLLQKIRKKAQRIDKEINDKKNEMPF